MMGFVLSVTGVTLAAAAGARLILRRLRGPRGTLVLIGVSTLYFLSVLHLGRIFIGAAA